MKAKRKEFVKEPQQACGYKKRLTTQYNHDLNKDVL